MLEITLYIHIYLIYLYGSSTIFPWKFVFVFVFVDKLAKKTARKTVRKLQDEPTRGALNTVCKGLVQGRTIVKFYEILKISDIYIGLGKYSDLTRPHPKKVADEGRMIRLHNTKNDRLHNS